MWGNEITMIQYWSNDDVASQAHNNNVPEHKGSTVTKKNWPKQQWASFVALSIRRKTRMDQDRFYHSTLPTYNLSFYYKVTLMLEQERRRRWSLLYVHNWSLWLELIIHHDSVVIVTSVEHWTTFFGTYQRRLQRHKTVRREFGPQQKSPIPTRVDSIHRPAHKLRLKTARPSIPSYVLDVHTYVRQIKTTHGRTIRVKTLLHDWGSG